MKNINTICNNCKKKISAELSDELGEQLIVCPHCDTQSKVVIKITTPAKSQISYSESVARRVRLYEIVTVILWFLLGVVQCILLYTAAAGIWNIITAVITLCNIKNIKPHNSNVTKYYDERKIGILIIAIVNLVLGAAIGVLLAAADWLIRGYVLKNASAFEE